ncbi:MAG TPA: sulfatase-like hydrolase/transferase [Allosphingosinicella sp.]|jgi:hypothetical protein
MEAALAALRWERRPINLSPFQNWLLCWLVLPHFSFCLVWFVGGPPRAWPIIVTTIVGIALHRAPFALRYAGFAGVMVYSLLDYICCLFNLNIRSLLYSLQFAQELTPSSSPEYVAAIVALLATMVAAWFAMKRPTTLNHPKLIVIVLCFGMLFSAADRWMSKGNRGQYKRTPTAGAPFQSAVQETGIARIATGERHVLMIVVEAMGLPADPMLRSRLVSAFARPELSDRYTMTSGDTLFYGSTTNGEMRELCARWGDYDQVLDKADPSCLPAQLAAKGYHTEAWHSFKGSMFERSKWYPQVGFQETRFGERLIQDGTGNCPGVFAGACDVDVPAFLAKELKAATKPQFLYWLTVNSHLPVLSDAKLKTDRCETFDAQLARNFPMTCRLLSLYDQTGRALARELAAADFPATDVLIVGDHIPPFFDRHHREQFEGDRVPWILLRAKAKPAPAPAKAAAPAV